ncbi:MAG TPA: RcpC/CpaB family pilus assembly protein [Acidimicrobiales bacterium]
MPNPRAVVGGFLVAASALALFVGYGEATAPPTSRYVVAVRDLAPGARVTADDLGTVAADLPDSMKAAAFERIADVAGKVVAGPIAEGELVQAGAVVSTDAAPGGLEVSFPVEAARALGGALDVGDAVDVLATFGAAGDTYTTTVVQGARVLAARDTARMLASSGTVTLTVAVATSDEARALVHAVNAGELIVVRADPSADAPDRTGTYRAPAGRDADASREE